VHVQLTLTTPRLILRPFTVSDAADVHVLVSAREVAALAANIPHPYQQGMAERWIATHESAYTTGLGVTFAITQRADERLCGAINFVIDPDHHNAELGYWIGLPYWNQGYAKEAARELIQYGFSHLDLYRIYASHLGQNLASGRVMQKVGMHYEGCLRQHLLKWGVYDDVIYYGVIRNDFSA
jgi:RimJ/RimL family protein N-acetyltransferase